MLSGLGGKKKNPTPIRSVVIPSLQGKNRGINPSQMESKDVNPSPHNHALNKTHNRPNRKGPIKAKCLTRETKDGRKEKKQTVKAKQRVGQAYGVKK
ncbi:hypothetical protein V6N13_125613 [Hibiscus sabdariffa]